MASFFPSVDIEATALHNYHVIDHSVHNNNAQVMLVASWNLFNGWADLSSRQLAADHAALSVINRDAHYRLLMDQSASAWLSYQSEIKKRQELIKRVEKLKRIYEDFKKQFKVGRRSAVELIDAQSSYFFAKNQYIIQEYAIDLSVYQILALTNQLAKIYQLEQL